jgi:hypothetical protein
MSSAELQMATKVYDCSRATHFDWSTATHEGYHAFYRAVSLLTSALGEEQQDPYWRPLVRQSKRWRFELAAAPLPLCNVVSPADHAQLTTRYGSPALLGMERAALLGEVLETAAVLAASKANPLLTALKTALGQSLGRRVTLCLGESRLIRMTEAVLRADEECYGMRVVSPPQLRGTKTAIRLVVLGSPRWLPDYLYTAPRSPHITTVCYSWLAQRPEPPSTFSPQALLSERPEVSPPVQDKVDTVELSAGYDLTATSDIFVNAKADVDTQIASGAVAELAKARPVLLEDDTVAFLDGEDGATAIIIDLAEKGKRRVRRSLVSDLEAGAFLLVRAGGGGDLILPIANHILGTHAHELRASQEKWKELLKASVATKGIKEACRQLSLLGAQRATMGNLRRWIWARSIRPNDPADFHAVAALCGLESQSALYWKNMGIIENAHIRAGQIIRRQLLAIVHNADLEELEKLGTMTFTLPGIAGGNLCATRIREVGSDTMMVPSGRIGHTTETRL